MDVEAHRDDVGPEGGDERAEQTGEAMPRRSAAEIENDPELNPDVERASEVDDITGSIPVVGSDAGDGSDAEAAAGAASAGSDAGEADRGSGDASESSDASPASVGVGDESGERANADGDGDGEGDDELTALRTERDQFKELAQRVQAEFDNFRKRSAAQAQVEAERAAGRIVEALLPVLDAAEAAYVRHPDEVGPLLNSMLGELRKHGLETIDLEGKPFDPNLAEAVAHEPGEGDEVIVAEVLRSGYQWKGKTLRAAMVRTKS